MPNMTNRFSGIASSDSEEEGRGFQVVRSKRGRPKPKRRDSSATANRFLSASKRDDADRRPPRDRRERDRNPREGRRPRPRDPLDMGKYCKYCHEAGEPREVYTAHFARATRHPDSDPVCPRLKANICCEYCSEYGHSVKDCPTYDPTDATFGADADVGRKAKAPEPQLVAEESSYDKYVRYLAGLQSERVFLRMVPSVGLVQMEDDMRRRRGVAWVDLI